MKNRDDLIYDLIFSKKDDFEIDVGDYIKEIYNYEDFLEEIKGILLKSKVMIVGEGVQIINKNKTKIIWTLKVKK